MPTPEQSEVISGVLAQACAAQGVPGASAAVLADGRLLVGAAGETAAGAGAPCTAQTRFPMGCLTKAFATTAIMRLVERGLLDVEAPITAYLPELAAADCAWPETRVGDLLSYTAGVDDDAWIDTGASDDRYRKYVAEVAAQPRLAPPGMFFAYTSQGHTLCAHAAERVTGSKWEDILRREVLGPLSLESILSPPPGSQIAREHIFRGGKATPQDFYYPRCLDAAGSGLFNALPTELVALLAQHLPSASRSGATPLLASETVRRMQAPRLLVANDPFGFGTGAGLGWFTQSGGLISLRGRGHGTRSQIAFLPEQEGVAVVMANAPWRGSPFAFGLEALLEHFFGFDARPKPVAEATDGPAADDRFVGTYARAAGRVEVFRDEGGLAGRYRTRSESAGKRPGKAFRLEPRARDSFFAVSEAAPPFALVSFHHAEGTGRASHLQTDWQISRRVD